MFVLSLQHHSSREFLQEFRIAKIPVHRGGSQKSCRRRWRRECSFGAVTAWPIRRAIRSARRKRSRQTYHILHGKVSAINSLRGLKNRGIVCGAINPGNCTPVTGSKPLPIKGLDHGLRSDFRAELRIIHRDLLDLPVARS